MNGCVVAGFINDFAPIPGHDRQKIAFWRIYDKVVIGYFYMKKACWEPGMRWTLCTTMEPSISSPKGSTSLWAIRTSMKGVRLKCNGSIAASRRTAQLRRAARRSALPRGVPRRPMVVRCSPRLGEPTSAFMVFRMAQPEVPGDDDDDVPSMDGRMLFVRRACSRSYDDVVQYIWRELPSLDGRMLFVGRGCSCSKSYAADQYPGVEGGVYFFDHRVTGQGGEPALYTC
ncbi:hypothetical protein E2562_016901 [Oryza meyeriana var. granulata]|uniref:Uncharacterized protein n=1 Tax=Oryza meyeriana var. granulata TaxID=110450 RepID=A0A6G1DYB3_9ORYZ|nr:hypothetical protein E2562_016901 [Oryza meyeriana var. granulata]